MEDNLRLAIIGDYNFAYHSHNATNQAIAHCEDILDMNINFYWVKEKECCEENIDFEEAYDAVIIAPGPYEQIFYIKSIINKLMKSKCPVLATGDCFKILVEDFFERHDYKLHDEKIISDNLIEGNYFTSVNLQQLSKSLGKLYEIKSTTEYSSSRFSVLPQYTELLNAEFEIGARNQYFDPEILIYKNHRFFIATMFCPQIISTRDLPHPLITQFIKTAVKQKQRVN